MGVRLVVRLAFCDDLSDGPACKCGGYAAMDSRNGLEHRGHRFCRYADEYNIYVKSRCAGERVMSGIGRLISYVLKLKVNTTKSAVDRPWNRKFLGFSFYRNKDGIGARIHSKSIRKVKSTIRKITNRNHSRNFDERLENLAHVTIGCLNYFGVVDAKKIMEELDGWTRKKLRFITLDEPPYTERYVRWRERTGGEIITCLLLDLDCIPRSI